MNSNQPDPANMPPVPPQPPLAGSPTYQVPQAPQPYAQPSAPAQPIYTSPQPVPPQPIAPQPMPQPVQQQYAPPVQPAVPAPAVAPVQPIPPPPQALPSTPAPYGQQPSAISTPAKATYVPVVLVIGTLLFLLITVVLLGDIGKIGELKRFDPEGMGLLSAFVYIRVVPALALLAGYVLALVTYFKNSPLFNKAVIVVLASGAWLLVDAIIRGLLLNHVLSANNITSRESVFNPVSFVISFILLGLGFVVWWLPKHKRA